MTSVTIVYQDYGSTLISILNFELWPFTNIQNLIAKAVNVAKGLFLLPFC